MNQNHNEIPYHACRMAEIIKAITSVGEEVKKLGYSCIGSRIEMVYPCWRRVLQFFKKVDIGFNSGTPIELCPHKKLIQDFAAKKEWKRPNVHEVRKGETKYDVFVQWISICQ